MKVLLFILFPIILSAQWKVCDNGNRLIGPVTNTTGMPCLKEYPAIILGDNDRNLLPFEDKHKEISIAGDTAYVEWVVDTIPLPTFKRRVANVLRQRVKVFNRNMENNVYDVEGNMNEILYLIMVDTPPDSSALLTKFKNSMEFVYQKKKLFRTGKQALQNATTYGQVLNIYNQAMEL